MFQTIATPNAAEKTLTIDREFKAPLALTWRAMTEAELLVQWWAPRPWQAVSLHMDFRPGGYWHYCMQGPEGDKHYGRIDYDEIAPLEYFLGSDYFCDEQAQPNTEIPATFMRFSFHEKEASTLVRVVVRFVSEEALEQMVQMGAVEGFSQAHQHLDELLASLQG